MKNPFKRKAQTNTQLVGLVALAIVMGIGYKLGEAAKSAKPIAAKTIETEQKPALALVPVSDPQ